MTLCLFLTSNICLHYFYLTPNSQSRGLLFRVRVWQGFMPCPEQGCNSLFLSAQSPGSAANEIFAKLEVYLWLGLAKYSKEATNNLPEEFLPIFDLEEEEDEEQKRSMPPGMRKLPVHLACQGTLRWLTPSRPNLS